MKIIQTCNFQAFHVCLPDGTQIICKSLTNRHTSFGGIKQKVFDLWLQSSRLGKSAEAVGNLREFDVQELGQISREPDS